MAHPPTLLIAPFAHAAAKDLAAMTLMVCTSVGFSAVFLPAIVPHFIKLAQRVHPDPRGAVAAILVSAAAIYSFLRGIFLVLFLWGKWIQSKSGDYGYHIRFAFFLDIRAVQLRMTLSPILPLLVICLARVCLKV